LGVMRSDGDLRNFNVRWEAPIGSSMLRAHVGYAEVDYRLGNAFDVLDITGRASHVEIGLKHPVLRSRGASASVYTTWPMTATTSASACCKPATPRAPAA